MEKLNRINVISFRYGEKYGVDSEFDLNILKRLFKLESTSEGYIPAGSFNGIDVTINAKYSYGKEAKNSLIKISKEEASRNYKWYSKEKEKANNFKKELDCLKMQLEELKTESIKSIKEDEPKAERIEPKKEEEISNE